MPPTRGPTRSSSASRRSRCSSSRCSTARPSPLRSASTTRPTPRADDPAAGPPDNMGRVSASDPRERPIGVFDSGVGGLTVLHELLVALPHEDFVYLGDTA